MMQSSPKSFKEFAFSIGAAVLPVVIVILIQKPALRQMIVMKTVETARNIAVQQTQFWLDTSLSLARVYDRVRL